MDFKFKRLNDDMNEDVKVPFYKKPGFRYSALATVLTVVVIAVIVAANILATMLDARLYNMQLDFTASQDYSLSAENIDYIEKVDRDITVTVASTRDYYYQSYPAYVEYNYYYTDTSNGKYYYQTVQLLDKYPKINDHIKLQYIDPDTPAFTEYSEKYGDEINIGSIIVECTFKNSSGNAQTRHKVISFDDIYAVEAGESGYDYYISGSTLEQSLTSALYYVMQEQQDKALVLTGNGCDGVETFVSLLKQNNYDVDEISSIAAENIPDDVKLLIIAAPTFDFTTAEILKLDEYMSANKQFGRNIVYVASNVQSSMPNLDGFLKEWGIVFEDGTLYETDANFSAQSDHTLMSLADGETDFTKDIFDLYGYAIANARPMKLAFEQSTSYYTYNLVKSHDSVVIKPMDADDEWTPDDNADKDTYSAMALSVYVGGTDKDKNPLSSNVIAFASLDFLSENFSSAYRFSNQTVTLNIINHCMERKADTYYMTNKVINSTMFTVTEAQANVMKIIVQFVIPIIVIIIGFVIVFRRKRK